MSKQLGPEYFEHAFKHFAEMCAGKSPLYATISAGVADDPRVYRLASGGQKGQPAVNLLFGAVQYLLLSGARHPLAEFYPSVGGQNVPDASYPAFADFCGQFEQQIVEIVATRRVQTNEVGRCGLLLPAFSLASELSSGRPLHLIEIGASAGLNLSFDRYGYEYSNGHACGPESAVRIRTELRGDVPCPLPQFVPPVAGRVGVDIAPVDLQDAESIRWVASLIWADQLDRIALFRHAVAAAGARPPRIIEADGMDVLADLVEGAPPDALPCVFHSHALCQMNTAWHEAFDELLTNVARERDLAHVSLEWLRDDPGPQLRLSAHWDGAPRVFHLADCDNHGRWLRWLADSV